MKLILMVIIVLTVALLLTTCNRGSANIETLASGSEEDIQTNIDSDNLQIAQDIENINNTTFLSELNRIKVELINIYFVRISRLTYFWRTFTLFH